MAGVFQTVLVYTINMFPKASMFNKANFLRKDKDITIILHCSVDTRSTN